MKLLTLIIHVSCVVFALGLPRNPFNWRASHGKSGPEAKADAAHPLKSATLLRTKARTATRDVDLVLAGDRLQGIMDAVNTRFADVRTALQGITTTCQANMGNSVDRTKAQNVKISDLETLKIQQAGVKGRMQAELDHLWRTEDETKSSYDSTVALRAKARQAFVDRNATLTDQEAVVGGVVEKMKEQNAVEGGPDETSSDDASSLLSISMRQTRSSGPSGGFATIIGIFTNMADTLKKEIHENAVQHAERDSEYLALVKSHKKSLQNLDAEYETKNAHNIKATSTVRDASFEIDLRNEIVTGDARTETALREMCGHDNSKVPAALSAGERLLAKLQGQVTRAITSINDMPALADAAAASGAALTQFRSVRTAHMINSTPSLSELKLAAKTNPANKTAKHPVARQLALNRSTVHEAQHTETPPAPIHQSIGVMGEVLRLAHEAHERHPSWHSNRTSSSLPVSTPKHSAVAATKAHLDPAASRKSIKERNAKKAAMWALLRASEATKDDALRTMAVKLPVQSISQDLHVLAAYSHKLEIDSQVAKRTKKDDDSDDSEDGALSSELQTCVDDKRRLTAEIVAARQAARASRTQAASAKARRDAVAGWVAIVDAQKLALTDAEASHKTSWETIGEAGTTLESDLEDGITEMDGVDAELATYLGTDGAPPKAAAMEIAFKGIRATLNSLKNKTPTDITSLSSRSSTLIITYQALLNALSAKESELNDDKVAQEASLSSAEADVTKHETTETDVMAQRQTVEQDCEAHMTSSSAAAVSLIAHKSEVESAAIGVATQLLSGI